MIILVDTDVLIDVALDRERYAKAAGSLLDALESRPRSAFVAWHSLSNLYYLVKPERGRANTKQFFLDLIEFIDVAPTTTESLRYAATLEMNDFEIAMQVSAAIACRADVIATRNIKDYAKSPVKAATPTTILSKLTKH